MVKIQKMENKKEKIKSTHRQKILKIEHTAGFFSCCSQIAEKLLDYNTRYNQLPDQVDISSLFSLYKTSAGADISRLFFEKDKKNPVSIKRTAFNNDYQFIDYKLLDFSGLSPLIERYFSPSMLVENNKKLIKSKYSLDPDKYIAVYRRGLDKVKEIPYPPTTDEWLKVISDIRRLSPELKILIISDEQEFIEECRLKLDDITTIKEVSGLTREEYSKRGYAFHKIYKEDFILNFLSSILIASECKAIITSSCNVGLWIALFRGNTENLYQFIPKYVIKDEEQILTTELFKEIRFGSTEKRNYRQTKLIILLRKLFKIGFSLVKTSTKLAVDRVRKLAQSIAFTKNQKIAKQKSREFSKLKFATSYLKNTGKDSVLVIEHNGGFYSCCSQMLYHIIKHYESTKELPKRIDGSGLFFWYKQYPYDDILKKLFTSEELAKEFNKEVPYFSNEMQYIDYQKLELERLQPLIQKYFSPSEIVKKRIDDIEMKYKIIPNNTIAVFYRGNDKQAETNIGSYIEWKVKLQEVIGKNKGLDLLVQTDENEFLAYIKESFPKVKVIEDLPRINKNQRLAVHSTLNNGCETEFAISFLATTLILSKSKILMTHSGNCGLWACLFRGNSHNVVQYLNNYWCG